jgi:hypothetical protein
MGLTDYTISDKKYWQAGRDYERQRIIKLLEEDADNNYYALQLIKGEQK